MFRYVRKGNGFSLVEVMIALCILLLVFMGLMQTALLSIDSNMRNILRDEALRIAAQRMDEVKSVNFDNVVNDDADGVTDDARMLPACANPPINDGGPYEVEVLRNFRSIQDFPYGTRRTVTNLDASVDTKRIQITVRWEYRGECYTHTIISLRRR